MVRVFRGLPSGRYKSKCQSAVCLFPAGREPELLPVPRVFSNVTIASERIAEIEKMVNDPGIGPLSDHRVEAVISLCVGVIEPREEHLQPSKVAPAIMRNQVIRIITTSVFVPKRTNDSPRHGQASHQPDLAI